jgi:hypothetical protein
MTLNKHGGLLRGGENLYPKMKQGLRSIEVVQAVESKKFTPG